MNLLQDNYICVLIDVINEHSFYSYIYKLYTHNAFGEFLNHSDEGLKHVEIQTMAQPLILRTEQQ